MKCHGQLGQFPAALQGRVGQGDSLLECVLDRFVTTGDKDRRNSHGESQIMRDHITDNYRNSHFFEPFHIGYGIFFTPDRINRDIVIEQFT